jgi:hypothetical protein
MNGRKGKSSGRRDEDSFSADRSDEYAGNRDYDQRDDSSRDGYSRNRQDPATSRRNRNGDLDFNPEASYDLPSDARNRDKSGGKNQWVDDGGRQRGNGRKYDEESDRSSNLKTGDQYDDFEYSSSRYGDYRERSDRRQQEKSSSRSGRNGGDERLNGKGRGYDDYPAKDR